MGDPQMALAVMAFAFMIVITGGRGSVKGTPVSRFIAGQVVSIGARAANDTAEPFGYRIGKKLAGRSSHGAA